MKVIHFHRKPRTGFHSIENMYADVRAYLEKENVAIKKVQMPFTCKTHLGKILNIFYTFFFSANVYHVTGDLHYIALALPESKTIISAHSVEGGRKELVGWKGKLYKFLYFTLPNKHCKYWTAVSQFTKQELVEYLSCNPEKVKVIFNPLLPDFKASKATFNTQNPTILQVGTNPRKNITNLIHALQNLSCRLHIVGIPTEEELQLLKKYKIDYKITPKASPKQMNEIYQACDIMVIVSLNESFGMPIIEAQQVGRIVIASNVTAMPEIGGEAAIYVDPTKVVEIREAIKQAINNAQLREQLINTGFVSTKKFALTKVALDYLKLYQTVYNA